MTRVALIKCEDYAEVKKAIDKVLKLIGGLQKYIKRGDKVLLKPNLSDPLPPEKAAVTHPLFLQAVIELVKEISPHVWIAEQSAPSSKGTTEQAYRISGTEHIAKKTGTMFRNMQDEDFVVKDIPNHKILEKTDFATAIFQADVIINLPKLKSHGLTYLTGAIKNCFGFIHPDERQYAHGQFKNVDDFSRCIVDIFSYVKPKLSIMDAILCMEGDEGPSYGRPIHIGHVICSNDAVATDSVAAKLTGHNPLAIPMIKDACERSLGEGDISKINVVGASLNAVEFCQHTNYINRHSKKGNAQPMINQNLCTKCGACYTSCPVKAIEKIDNGFRINNEKCIRCYCCIENCIYEAVRIEKESVGADLIRLGLTCNQKCVFCTAYTPKQEALNTKEVKKDIDFLSKKGYGKLALTGGEPTLRKDLTEIVKYAKNAGIKTVELQTNGVLLKNKIFVKRLVDAGIGHFFVSIHSHKRKIYHEITGTDMLNDAIACIENLAELGTSVQICHVINTLNFIDLLSFCKFMYKEFGNKMSWYFGFVRPNKELANDSKIVPRLVEIEPYLYQAFDFCKRNSIYFEVEGIPLCYMQGFEEHNVETKRLQGSACYHLEKGTQKQDTHSDHVERNKAKGIACDSCFVESICPKVWKEYADIYGTEELFPVFDKKIIEKVGG